MVGGRRWRIFVLALATFSNGTFVGAQTETDLGADATDQVDSPDGALAGSAATKPVEIQESRMLYQRRWESGLDIQRTTIVDAGTTQFAAKWQRRFWTGTSFGAGFAALPLSVERTKDEVPVKIGLFAMGLTLEQTLYESRPLRFSLGLGVGTGQLYTRYSPVNEAEIFKTSHFQYVEPTAYAFFFSRWRLDMGVMVGSRLVSFKSDYPVKAADVTAAVFGLSFRSNM